VRACGAKWRHATLAPPIATLIPPPLTRTSVRIRQIHAVAGAGKIWPRTLETRGVLVFGR